MTKKVPKIRERTKHHSIKALKENQDFRIQGPRSSRKIKIRTQSQEQELEGSKYLQQEQDQEQARTKNVVP